MEPPPTAAGGASGLSHSREKLLWFLCAGIFLGLFGAAFLRTLPYPLVFDDFANVLGNRAIRYLSHPRIFFESEHSRGRPLSSVTFALSYAFAGLSLSWLRAPSLLLHFANAVLVALLYRRWFKGQEWAALFAGGIFLLHPLAVDPVIYLSARGSLLVLFFLQAALLFHGAERAGPWRLLGFLAAIGAAFLSRESAVAVLPLLLLLHHAYRRRASELWPFLLPLLLGACAILWLKASFLAGAWHGYFRIQGEADLAHPLEYLRLSLSLWPRLHLLFFNPAAHSLDHSVALPAHWFAPAVLCGLAIWATFGATLVQFVRTRSMAVFPVLWLACSLAPTHTVFPLLDPFSERHFYLALPALAWGLAWLCARHRLSLAAGMAFVCLVGATATPGRARQWQSPAGLWLDAHAKAPAKFRAAFNAAVHLVTERGDKSGALRIFASTLSMLKPGALPFEEQERGLSTMEGILTASVKESGSSAEEVLQGLFPEGGYWREQLWLRSSHGKSWALEWEKALARIEGAALDPQSRDLLWVKHTLGLLRAGRLREEGKKAEALKAYEEVFGKFQEAHFPYWTEREALGDLYLAAGREPEALQQFELAAFQYKVFKRFPYELHRKLESIYTRRGDELRASDAAGELLRAFPDDPALRRLYSGHLGRIASKNAARQAAEAEFYSQHAVSTGDAREQLSP